jgi:pimeloyl-ACP methyl ester carboxylesterase
MDRQFQVAAPRHRYLASAGGRTHLIDIGGAAQTPLVFLAGLGSCAAGYHGLLEDLARDRRVIAIDRFGTGLSTGLRGPGHPRMAWVDQVAATVASLGLGPVDLVGHSLGGMVAGALAVERPELIRRLALVSPLGVAREHPWTWSPALLPGALAIAGRVASRRFLPGTVNGQTGQDPCQLAADRWWNASDLDSVAKLIRPRGFRSETLLLPELGLLQGRVLLIWGDQDRQMSLEAAQRELLAYPALPLEVLPGAGHLAPFEHPGEVAQAIRRWLDAA